jgi:hypothetical protein
MLRLAFGTAGSFTLAEALDWELSFLIPVLVVQECYACADLHNARLFEFHFGLRVAFAILFADGADCGRSIYSSHAGKNKHGVGQIASLVDLRIIRPLAPLSNSVSSMHSSITP